MSAAVYREDAGYGRHDRAFRYAVLVSLALHALLFLAPAMRESRRSEPPPGPIAARLVQPRPVATPPAPVLERPAAREEPTQPVPEVKPPPDAKPAPASKPPPVAKSEPRPLSKPVPQAPAQPAPSALPEPAPAAPPSAPAAPPVAAAPPAGAAPSAAKPEAQVSAAPQPSEAPDRGSIDQYRLQVISAARKYKRYPRVAMDNNWEGAAEISMVIGANGMISALSIKTSSGHAVLDQQALEMFKRAKPLVPIPAALRGKEFTVTLRAIYSLKEPEA